MTLTASGVRYAINEATLLDGVSLEFRPGQFSLVVGPNGAGKSTLVRVLSRQLVPQQGEVRYAGRSLGDWHERDLARVRAVLSQSIEVTFPLRVEEIVMMGRYPHFTGAPTAADHRASEEAMRYFDVHDWTGRNYQTLSGGERQRVQFARVMAQIWYPVQGSPRCLILDEPLTFLDIHYQFDFMRRVRRLLGQGDLVAAGVVHDLNLAARFADHVVLMSRGRVLASGPPRDVLTPELVDAAFGVRPVVYEDDGGRVHLLFQ